MPVYRTQCQIATADNVSANFATNTLHVLAPDVVELALWHAAVAAMYQAFDAYMNNQVRTTNGLLLKSYDVDDPEPRAPVLTNNYNLTPSGAGLPPEVSLVMSFQAEQASGIPQARRRNRIYIPFLQSSANDTQGRPSTSIVSAVQAAGAALLAASGPTSNDWQWIVYSATDATFDLVENGWVDNEWDIQRRRGRPATTRSVF